MVEEGSRANGKRKKEEKEGNEVKAAVAANIFRRLCLERLKA